jgi:hypothetical protein
MTNDEASFELIEFKADASDPEDAKPKGLFGALVSVFKNTDRNGDRVMPGAFTKTLEAWRESGKQIPVVWSHDHKNPDSFIGSVDPADVQETDKGLVVAGKLDIDSNPKAAKVFDLLRTGKINGWSFGFKTNKSRRAADGAREVFDLDLFEVGPLLAGANPLVATLGTKEPLDGIETKVDAIVDDLLDEHDAELELLIETKVGRAISARTRRALEAAMAQIRDVLAVVDEETEVPEPVAATPEAKEVTEDVPTSVLSGENAALAQELADAGVFLAERSHSS